ncbi:trafficking protein particle complex subunit 10 [Acrasis kona]|uniref:Trafficking protein particle complex subunit 10 n=1 Tax=Acrasis kona TaxID=1008807 RepID=A0AAW2ZTH9_9EUKA
MSASNLKTEELNVGDPTNYENPYVVVWELHGSKSGLIKIDPNPTFYQSKKSNTKPLDSSEHGHHNVGGYDIYKEHYPLWCDLEPHLRPFCNNIVVNDSGRKSAQLISKDGILNMNRSPRSVDSPDLSVNLFPNPNKSTTPITPNTLLTNTSQTYQSIIASNPYHSSVEQFKCEFRTSNDPRLNNCLSRQWSVMYTNPYMHVMIVMCDDVDYKNEIKPKLLEWVSYMDDKQYEYLILYVPTAQSENGLMKFFNRTLNKINLDFNKNKNGMDQVLKISLRNNPPASSYKNISVRVSNGILMEFSHRCNKYDQEVKKFEANRKLPGWQFGHYFIAKENLALTLEQFGLHVNALGIYSHLFSFYNQHEDIQSESFIHAIELNYIMNTTTKHYRSNIYQNNISEFELYCYIFARQIQLFFKMNNPYEAAIHTKEFIPHMVDDMYHFLLPNNLQMDGKDENEKIQQLRNYIFIHTWAYCTTQSIVTECQTKAFESSTESLPMLFRTLGDLYIYSRSQLTTLCDLFNVRITKEFNQHRSDPIPDHILATSLSQIMTTTSSIQQFFKIIQNQSECVTLYLELSSAASKGYASGFRERFHHSLNGQIAQIRFEQENYKEALLLWKGQLMYYYADGWYQLATNIRSKVAQCECKLNLMDSYINSCLSLLSDQRVHTNPIQKEFYFKELTNVVNGDLNVEKEWSIRLGPEFIVGGLEWNDSRSLVIDNERVTLSCPVGNTIHFELQIKNITLVNDFYMDSICFLFKCEDLNYDDDDDRDGDDDDDQLDDLKIQIKLESRITLPRDVIVKVPISIQLDRRGLFILNTCSIGLGNLNLIIDRITLPGDFYNQSLSSKPMLPPSQTRYTKLPHSFVKINLNQSSSPPSLSFTSLIMSTNSTPSTQSQTPIVQINSPPESVLEMSLDSFLGNQSNSNQNQNFPSPLSLHHHHHKSNDSNHTPSLNTDFDTTSSISESSTSTSTSRTLTRQSKLLKSKSPSKSSKSKSPSNHDSIYSPSQMTIPSPLISPRSQSNLSIQPLTVTNHKKSIKNQETKRLFVMDVLDSPSTCTLQIHNEYGNCFVVNQSQIMLVTIHSNQDSISNRGCKLQIETIDHDDDDEDGGSMDGNGDELILENFEFDVPSLDSNQSFTISVPIRYDSNRSDLHSMGDDEYDGISNRPFDVTKNLKFNLTFQKRNIATDQPLYMISQLESITFHHVFVNSYAIHHMGDSSILNVNVKCNTPESITIQDYEWSGNSISWLNHIKKQNVTLCSQQSNGFVFLLKCNANHRGDVFRADLKLKYKLHQNGKLNENVPLQEHVITMKWKLPKSINYVANVDLKCGASLIRVGSPCTILFNASRIGHEQQEHSNRYYWRVLADDKYWICSGHVKKVMNKDTIECYVVPLVSGYIPLPSLCVEKSGGDDHLDEFERIENVKFVYRLDEQIENKMVGNKVFIHPDNDAQMGSFSYLNEPVVDVVDK